jgi:hypothetical protein
MYDYSSTGEVVGDVQAPGLLDLAGDDLMEDLLQVDAISHGQDWMTDL